MADGGERRTGRSHDPHRIDRRTGDDERWVLHRLRVVSGAVILFLIVLLVVADTLGRLYIRPDFRVGELFLGSLIGALLLLVGIDVASRLPGSRNDR